MNNLPCETLFAKPFFSHQITRQKKIALIALCSRWAASLVVTWQGDSVIATLASLIGINLPSLLCF